MAGAFVCALGIVPTVRHADYIGSWLVVLREDNHAIGPRRERSVQGGRFFEGLSAQHLD
jgi:antirestriction protein ArdC